MTPAATQDHANCSRPTLRSPLQAHVHSRPNPTNPKRFVALHCMHSLPYIYIFCLSASLLFIFIPSWPLHLFLCIQYPQIMRQVWPIAQIRVHQYFCLTVCVCVCIVWLEQLQMLLKQERWCILLSVHYEIEKKSLRADE